MRPRPHTVMAGNGRELSPGSEGEMDDKSFPGLNKSHGFFNLIERNQKARDSYHQEQEERKQVSLARPLAWTKWSSTGKEAGSTETGKNTKEKEILWSRKVKASIESVLPTTKKAPPQ